MTGSIRRIQIAEPSVGDEEWHALREPLQTGWLTQGPKVKEFEEAFAVRHGVRFAHATTSCTTGLHLALNAIGVGPGDEVIVPAFTWVATANAVLYCGATPVFADVSSDTYNVDPRRVQAAITNRTRAVIAVHMFGLCADVDAIAAILPPGVDVVEDAACAAGAELRGRPAGSLGRVAAFSFHPRKSITTGEGGMVTTDDPHIAATIDRLRNHGASVSEEVRHQGPAPYLMSEFNELGYNYRMTDLQAAVGKVQLGKLDEFVEERNEWAGWYGEALADIPWLITPKVPEGYGHAWQAYVTRVEDAPISRNEIMVHLHELGISIRPGTHAVTTLGYYRTHFDVGPYSHPVAAGLESQTMAIPLHNRMSSTDYMYVADALHGIS